MARFVCTLTKLLMSNWPSNFSNAFYLMRLSLSCLQKQLIWQHRDFQSDVVECSIFPTSSVILLMSSVPNPLVKGSPLAIFFCKTLIGSVGLPLLSLVSLYFCFFCFLTGTSQQTEDMNMRAANQLIRYDGKIIIAPLNPPTSPSRVKRL